MDSTEKKVIRSLNNVLIDAAKQDFESADIVIWANFAKRMKTSIENASKILNDLLEDDNKENDSNIKL